MVVDQDMVGALSARPLSWDRPRAVMCFEIKSRATCLVNMSAGLSAPAILSNEKSPFRMRSCIHKSAVARCLTLPKPRRREMPMAAVASDITLRDKDMPRSVAMVWRPSPCAAPLEIPVNSASADDNATVDCVVDQCLIRCRPLYAAPPEVDLRVT